jgi:hypothetical protein
MPTRNADSLEVLLREFDQLKAEQIHRIGHRDGLTYAQLVVAGALLGFAVQADGSELSFLVVPLASTILGWMHLANDRRVTEIGHYIRNSLSKRVFIELRRQQPEPPPSPAFEWEDVVRTSQNRLGRKVVQFFITC